MAAVHGNGAKPAWGLKTAAAVVDKVSKSEEEDEECSICFERRVSTHFQPCQHGACSDCVDSLRRQVIFKADKGLKCPYCRQFIQGYTLAGSTGDSKAKQKLKEANAAAKAAALARMPHQKKETDKAAKSKDPNEWKCSQCNNLNFSTRKVCNRCNTVAPSYVIQAMMTGSKQMIDPLKASRKDIQDWAIAKLHPSFNPSLAECGMPFDAQSATLTGDIETAKTALVKGQHKRLQRIFEFLLSDNFIQKLVFDFYGNFTLQDMIEAAMRLRVAAAELHLSNQLTKEQADAASGSSNGQDYLSRIAIEISAVSDRAITHEKGNYVLEKVIDSGKPEDIIAVIGPLCKHPYAFVHHKYAVMKFAKAVDKLGLAAFNSASTQREMAAMFLNQLCAKLLADIQQFNRMLMHDLGGPMLLEAAQGGLPHENAVRLLTRVAQSVLDLTSKPNGMNMLKKFMGLEARDAECRELFVTNVCIMAERLQNRYADTVITLVDGCEIIQRMLELLSQETDETCHEWASVIIEDLIDHAQELFKSKKSKDLFLYAIQLPGDPDPIPARLQMIAMNNGRQFYQELAVEIYPDGNIPGVVSHPPPTASPPPPPKKTPEKKPPPGFLGDTNGHAGAEIDLKPEQAQLPQIKFGQTSPSKLPPGFHAPQQKNPLADTTAMLKAPISDFSDHPINQPTSFMQPPGFQANKPHTLSLKGQIVTPMLTPLEKAKGSQELSVADLLSALGPQTESTASKAPIKIAAKPLGQPLKKLTVTQSLETPDDSHVSQDFLTDLLGCLNIDVNQEPVAQTSSTGQPALAAIPLKSPMYKPPAATCQPRVAYTPPAAHSSALAPNPAKVTPAKISTLEIGTGAKKGGSATSAPLPAGNVLNGPKRAGSASSNVSSTVPQSLPSEKGTEEKPKKKSSFSHQKRAWDAFAGFTQAEPGPETKATESKAPEPKAPEQNLIQTAEPKPLSKPASKAPWDAAAHNSWNCPICTYEHRDIEAEFLTCAVCGSLRHVT